MNAGGSATSTLTVADLNGYAGTVNLTCSVTGNGAPLPGCSFSSTTLTVTTTGAASALNRNASGIYYAMWLPVVGLSLVGMRFAAPGTRKKKLLGFLLLGLIMAALFFLPACGGSSNNGGGGGGLYRMHSCWQLYGHRYGYRFGEYEFDPRGRSRTHRQLKLTHSRNTFISPMWGQPPSAVLGPKARSPSEINPAPEQSSFARPRQPTARPERSRRGGCPHLT